MINYKHLHYFHAVATHGTVARAAAQLHVTAQAISMQLQVLEEQLGEELFKKKGRLLELTEANRQLVELEQAMITEAADYHRLAIEAERLTGQTLAPQD